MEKNLLKYILFLITLIILVLVVLLLFHKKEERLNENAINEEIDEESFEVEVEVNIQKVLANDEFYNIKNCVQYYIDYVNDNNYDAILKVLDYNYSKNNNISINFLQQNLKNYEGTIFIITEMNKKEISLDLSIYYIKGYITGDNYSNFIEEGFTVVVDSSKDLFSIVPENLENNEEYEFNINLEADTNDYYNKIVYETFSNADIIREYFNLYREIATNNPDIAFAMLDEEYKEKRFGNSLERYRKYLNDIKVQNIYLSKYTFNFYDNYNEYVGIDKNGLYYIFKENSPMNFTLTLDAYTIESDKFITTYNSSDEQNKVMMNVDKFIMMLNNRDYENAYNLLDETFRANSFGSVDNFEGYIKNRYPLYYEIEYTSFSKKGSNVFVQNIMLKDITKTEENDNELNIIMRLDEGTGFTMSFET